MARRPRMEIKDVRRVVLRLVAISAVLAAALTTAGGAQAGTFYMNTCGYSGSPAPFAAGAGGGVSVGSACGNGGVGYEISSPGGVGNYAGANWSTTAPPGITITHVYTQNDLSHNIQGAGYYTSFNWDGGTTGQLPNSFGQGPSATGCCIQNFSTQHLSWAMTCRWSTCSQSAYMYIGSLTVTLSESQAPALSPYGALWNASGWIRGTWPIGLSASDPSGVCTSSIGLSGQGFNGPNATPNQSNYQQCPNPSWTTSIDTSRSGGSSGTGAGSMTLSVGATNAAGVPAGASRTINADNVRPAVSLSGPMFAYANAGTQYITASASAGPSGVSGISCSLDGGPYQYSGGASTSVAINGPGIHHTTCVAYNGARDTSGNVAASAPTTYTTTISEPTLAAIWFTAVKNPLRCRVVKKRQRVPAHYKFVTRHHKRVKIKVRAHYRTVKVKECHARLVRRKVAYWVTVRRHHRRVRVKRYRYVRSVVFPSTAHLTFKRGGDRKPAFVQGWLGSSWLSPLAGQEVVVYAAPDNGQGQFVPVAAAQTGSDGVWSAVVPPGPSRILEVAYPGALGGAIGPSVSSQIRLSVGARVRLRRTPRRHVGWGSSLYFSGYLPGGYIPRDGELMRVWLGLGSAHTTVATIRTRPNGGFSFTYHLGPGPSNVVRPYWFEFLTLAEGDYPFTPGASRKVYVTVGG